MKKPDPIEFQIPNTNTSITLIHLPVKEKVNGVYQVTGYKPYLEVAQRLIWFCEVANHLILETEIEREWEIVDQDGKPVYLVRFKAVIKNEDGKILRTARKTKSIESEKDYETCETGAVGRVLAYYGFGTQHATQDLAENEEDLADAPTYLKKGTQNESRKVDLVSTGKPTQSDLFKKEGSPAPINKPGNSTLGSNGEMDLPFDQELSNVGKKKFTAGLYVGKTIEEVFKEEIKSNHKWGKARMKDLNEGKDIPEIALNYLDYAEIMGVKF